MTFNPNADVSGNQAHRRGRGGKVAAAGGGIGCLGVVVLMVISSITGVNLLPFAPLFSGGGNSRLLRGGHAGRRGFHR